MVPADLESALSRIAREYFSCRDMTEDPDVMPTQVKAFP
jgi:hypothetical protein